VSVSTAFRSDGTARGAGIRANWANSSTSAFKDSTSLTIVAVHSSTSARAAGGAELREVHVFDRYTGEQVEPGHVSLALRLALADPERTLTDEEIEAAVDRVRAGLEAAGARPRESAS